MSTQEEDSLLQSDDDMDNFGNTVISVTGNKRTFFDAKQKKENKRRKWNLTARNNRDPSQVYLNDIGYESQSEERSENTAVITNKYDSFESISDRNFIEEPNNPGLLRISINKEINSRIFQHNGNSSQEM